MDAGVNVATAPDTICDGFHIYGTGDPLDYGLLMAYQAQYNSTSRAEIIYDMITYNTAKIMHLDNYEIKGASCRLQYCICRQGIRGITAKGITACF